MERCENCDQLVIHQGLSDLPWEFADRNGERVLVPHENEQCIRHLRDEIRNLKDDFFDFKREVKGSF